MPARALALSHPVARPTHRHHRYIFEEKEQKVKAGAAAAGGRKAATAAAKETVVRARLQELGPRFTLRLQSMQKGTFDSKGGEFEWVHRAEMDTSRRKFSL